MQCHTSVTLTSSKIPSIERYISVFNNCMDFKRKNFYEFTISRKFTDVTMKCESNLANSYRVFFPSSFSHFLDPLNSRWNEIFSPYGQNVDHDEKPFVIDGLVMNAKDKIKWKWRFHFALYPIHDHIRWLSDWYTHTPIPKNTLAPSLQNAFLIIYCRFGKGKLRLMYHRCARP